MKELIKGLLLVVTGVALEACQDPPPLKLTAQQRANADTVYLRVIDTLRPELDSMCAARFEMEVDHLVDSLLRVWRREEAILREKYRRLHEKDLD